MSVERSSGRTRVVVLGAGFGGLELTTRLSEEFGEEIDLVLVDQNDAFVFGFSKLDVMFGRATPEAVRHPYRDIVKPGVRFVQSTIRAIDPETRRVQTDAGEFPIPPSPSASAALLEAFAERDIDWHPSREVYEFDPARNVALLRDGDEMPYDLFLAVPVHRAPRVVLESGLTKDGWIPVDSLTFETSYPGVFAIGDVAAVGTPRAGVFAEGHAAVAAEHVAARIRGTTSSAQYGGHGICYVEFGGNEVGMVDVTFFGDKRSGELIGPSADLAAEKDQFGSSRARRWFARDWRALPATP